MNHVADYLREISAIADYLFPFHVEQLVEQLSGLRTRGGILYIVGLGGSAANASHMSADMRKLCQIDAMSLDNMAEVTARANDESFESIFDGFLDRITAIDALFVLSVGGGTAEVSKPLVRAIDIAKTAGAAVFGIVGPNGGYTAEKGNCVIAIPCTKYTTPLTEAFQAVLWHCLVSHPKLQRVKTKW